MQENLVGYLLGALDADEHESVKRQIESNPEWRRELNALEARLAPLESERWQDIEPPAHLAAATCALVAEVAADSAAIDAHVTPRSRMSPVSEPPRKGASWSLMDMVVTAGIFAAISCLFLPSIGRSWDTARIVACQNNLRELFGGLSQFSAANNGAYPTPQVQGNEVMAGFFAPQLVEPRFVSSKQTMCPSQHDKQTVRLRMPTTSEFLEQRQHRSDLLAAIRKVYGYNIGYVDEEKYHRPTARNRNHVALVADRPVMTPFGPANNGHGGRGLNVLMEDGSVKTLPNGVCTIGSDNIFLNDEGRLGPGVHENDTVIGPSIQRLRVWLVVKLKISGQPSATAPAPQTTDSLPTKNL